MEVVLFYAIYLGAALLFTVAAVFAVGGALHAGTRKPQGFVVYFAALVVAVMVANTITSGRNLMLPDAQVLLSAPIGEGLDGPSGCSAESCCSYLQHHLNAWPALPLPAGSRIDPRV